jgi:hypothetical protein
MSSCDDFCYIYFPEASFASATSASSRTGDEPIFCRFVVSCWAALRNRKMSKTSHSPTTRPISGSVPSVADQWSSSRPSRPLRFCSVLRPRSSPAPHETNVEKPENSTRVSARSALLRLASKQSSAPPSGIFSHRDHPLLQPAWASHTPFLPPATLLHQLPLAPHQHH